MRNDNDDNDFHLNPCGKTLIHCWDENQISQLPEYPVRCGEIKATTICLLNISNIHLNGRDAHSYTIVLEEKGFVVVEILLYMIHLCLNIIWNVLLYGFFFMWRRLKGSSQVNL